MTVKQLKEELNKYPDDTLVFVVAGEHCDDVSSYDADGFVEDESFDGRKGIAMF